MKNIAAKIGSYPAFKKREMSNSIETESVEHL